MYFQPEPTVEQELLPLSAVDEPEVVYDDFCVPSIQVTVPY